MPDLPIQLYRLLYIPGNPVFITIVLLGDVLCIDNVTFFLSLDEMKCKVVTCICTKIGSPSIDQEILLVARSQDACAH